MSAIVQISDSKWALVAMLFDPPNREGEPARCLRRDVVDAILFLARTGCQWRYRPHCCAPWRPSGSSAGAAAPTACGRRR